jgi:histidinol phosphatase-like PHP family hydrolase
LALYVSWEVDYFDGGTYSFDPQTHLDGLDYVLLGYHYYDHVKGASPRALADHFVRIYMEMAQEPYADIIAHPFYVRPPPENHGAVLRQISDAQFVQVFEAMRDNGKAAEITAYQFSADLRDVEQSKRMYALARGTGVKFTLDSDAHSLDQVGGGLRCIHVLRELGFCDDDFVDFEGVKGS